jgi:ABC-type uncharacterized transport system fused permease/ATPase subunit
MLLCRNGSLIEFTSHEFTLTHKRLQAHAFSHHTSSHIVTLTSALINKQSLVGFNFTQEAREADFRYGLVRVRENAESVAFYRGETDEKALLSLVRTCAKMCGTCLHARA